MNHEIEQTDKAPEPGPGKAELVGAYNDRLLSRLSGSSSEQSIQLVGNRTLPFLEITHASGRRPIDPESRGLVGRSIDCVTDAIGHTVYGVMSDETLISTSYLGGMGLFAGGLLIRNKLPFIGDTMTVVGGVGQLVGMMEFLRYVNTGRSNYLYHDWKQPNHCKIFR